MKNKDKKLIPIKEAAKLNKKSFLIVFKNYPQVILSKIFFVMWEALTPYVGIYLSALIIDELSGERNKEKVFNLVLITLISAAVISLISALLNKWRSVQEEGLWSKIKNIFTRKLLSMDFESIDRTETHELYSTIQQNMNGGGWGLTKVIYNVEELVSAFFTLFGGIVLTFSLFTKMIPSGSELSILNDPLVVFAVVFLMAAVTYISPALSTKANSYWATNADSHRLGNRLFSHFGFLGYDRKVAADMRIYRQDKICEKYSSDKTGVFGSQGYFSKLARGVMGAYNSASAAVSVIFTGLVYAFVCLKAWAGAFGVGSVTQYVAAVTKLSGSISSLIRTIGDMRNNASFLKLVIEFLDIESKIQRGNKKVPKLNFDEYEIEFKNVSFKYPGSENYALKNVSMKFKNGERMAVVGQNGSGKTTFIKLLCRLYDPTEGEILLNGVDIREYDYEEYMNIFSVVFQDFSLFAYKLGENVASSINYDRERALDSLTKAGFKERLEKMDKGLDTYLYKNLSKEGVDISGGERQKIALARTLYKDAPFIILDEPTAALDPIAESEVYSNFNDMVGEKSAVYISHRLSSCRFCSDIVVFNEGKLIERGSHEELIEKGGKYSELWYAQAQYYT